jgi:hypothetical protein
MKLKALIMVLLIILLVACQTATPVETEAPAPVETLAPDPIQAVKTPTVATPEPTGSGPYPGAVEPTKYDPNVPAPYPGPGEGGTAVEWDEATRLILAGEVAQLTQYDNLMVMMILRDGKTVNTRQPAMDAVLDLIDECGDLCADIEIPIQ